MSKVSIFSVVTAATLTCASASLAQPFTNEGSVEGWNIFLNESTKNCLMEKVESNGFVVQIARTGEGEEFGRLGVYSPNPTDIKDGETRELTFDLDGERFTGEATGSLHEGYQGGYAFANNPNFGAALAQKQTLTIEPDSANPVVVDLSGTMAAMDAVKDCQLRNN
jgi:hypothetical protein